MRFGFFDQFAVRAPPVRAPALPRYSGPDSTGLMRSALIPSGWAELHFGPSTSIMASPLMVLATAAQHTERIRLGTAVTLLPLHSPMKMAEEARPPPIFRAAAGWSSASDAAPRRCITRAIISQWKRVGSALRKPSM